MKPLLYSLLILLTLALLQWGVGCTKTKNETASATRISFPQPAGWPEPAYDFSRNPLTKEGVALGKKLFFDGRLSRDGNFPCVSCHQPFAAFATFDHDFSHGFDNQFTTRNAPAVVNLAWHRRFNLDGAFSHIEEQVLSPITAPNEMAETLANVLAKLNADLAYQQAFAKAFGQPEITQENLTKALTQYLLMLVSATSRYDQVKQGKASFTPNEEAGYQVFLAKKCQTCHTEPLFTNLEFASTGLELNPVLKDIGRMRVTGNPEDSLKFKVPSLRNVMLTAPYMHDGRFWSLQEVYDHYHPKTPLSAVERSLLTEFFKTLTDEALITNPDLSGNP